MNLFLDTDVIIDYLTDRKPFSDEAEKLFALIEGGKIRGHASALCFSNLYYLLHQRMSGKRSISLLKDLSDILNVVKVDSNAIQDALNSGFRDFEDAIQYYAAVDYKKIDLIVTRNTKDYKHASLPFMTPNTLLKTLQSGDEG